MAPSTTGVALPAVPASSPHSLGEASHHDTPSTNLTAYSPTTDDVANVIKGRSKVKVTEAHETESVDSDDRTAYEHDPFTVQTPCATRSGLSPTASNFEPGQAEFPINAQRQALTAGVRIASGRVEKLQGEAGHGRVSSLQANSVPDVVTPQVAHVTQARTDHGAIGEPSPPQALADALARVSLGSGSASSHEAHYRFSSIYEGTLTSDDHIQRAIKIISGSPTVSVGHLQPLLKDTYPSQCGMVHLRGTAGDALYVQFTDIRDAVDACANMRKCHWQVSFLRPRILGFEASDNAGPTGPLYAVNNYEGQLKVQVLFNPQNHDLTAGYVIPLIKATLAMLGDVKAIHSIPSGFPHVKEYCVEYFNVRDAARAVGQLNNHNIGHDLSMRLAINQDNAASPAYVSPWPPYVELPSITGRSTVPMNDPVYNPAAGFLAPASPPRPVYHSGSPSHSNHNQVDIERIRQGVDVRTTIMLRNIPNKIDQAMLKSILDETSFGEYDFMYLRIDFANNCNVGYAFINFEDPISIINFAMARAGRRWNRFSSDKVAEISYATIQGKDCLVQKFRNSSVMLEHPTFRPKIYTTGRGPDAGREEPFPGPDNPSKMRRSVENAECVGLFRRLHRSRLYTGYPFVCPSVNANNHDVITYPVRAERGNIQTHRPGGHGRHNREASVGHDAYNVQIGLFAPRHGQQYRDDQRRRRSQYDRGTTAAENEARYEGLFDPARVAHPGLDPRSVGTARFGGGMLLPYQ